jgi:hypothetical protein
MFPIANGNYSSTSNWNSDTPARVGTLPTTGDVVYCNGKTITVDVATMTAAEFRNDSKVSPAITAGGYLNFTNVTCDITGDVKGYAGAYFLLISNLSNITITGDVYGMGSTNTCYLNNSFTGSLDITGDVIGVSFSALTYVTSTNRFVVNITGNVTNNGYISINTQHTPNATPTIDGLITPSATQHAITVGTHNLFVQWLDYSVGYAPILGAFKMVAGAAIIVKDASGNPMTLTDPATTDQADEADVRYGTTYNSGGMTGKLVVPSVGSVANGVQYDEVGGAKEKIGTAVLTPQDVANAVAQVVGNQFDSFEP